MTDLPSLIGGLLPRLTGHLLTESDCHHHHRHDHIGDRHGDQISVPGGSSLRTFVLFQLDYILVKTQKSLKALFLNFQTFFNIMIFQGTHIEPVGTHFEPPPCPDGYFICKKDHIVCGLCKLQQSCVKKDARPVPMVTLFVLQSFHSVNILLYCLLPILHGNMLFHFQNI